MLKRLFLLIAGVAWVADASAQTPLRIGLITTLSGGGAILGEELKRGWDLGMDLVQNRIGGVETQVTVADDQLKPDVAVTAVDRMINQDKVDIVAGILWSNIMLAVADPVLKSGTVLLSTNAGPSQLAGKDCNALYISTSWQNDEYAEGTAVLMNADGMKNAYFVAPNYPAGKDVKAAFDHTFKGSDVGGTFFKLGQTDFQAELTEIRSRNPQSVVAFAPGAMGIAFMKQYQALGLGQSSRLYTINMVDYTTLPAIGEAALGTFHVSVYDPTASNPANQRFVAEFARKYKRLPTQYAMQAYDGVMLLDATVKSMKGRFGDHKALVAAMRKTKLESPRGPFSYNINNFPIQNMYKIEAVVGADGKPVLRGAGIAVPMEKDSHYGACPLKW